MQPPPEDLPTSQDRARLKGCKSEELYFGYTRQSQFENARKCAYLEREQPTLQDSVFGGAGLLTMIYTNGKGARRNLDLALKFTCEVDGAEAENFGRFQHLHELQQKNWAGDNFSLCDDATSGFMQGWCAHVEQRFADAEREKKLATLENRLAAPQRVSFQSLVKAAKTYFEASSRGEVDVAGTARAALEIEWQDKLSGSFVSQLEGLDSGKLPLSSPAELRKADKEINTVYSQVIANRRKHENEYGAVTVDGVRKAQRAWLGYRDAWTKFGTTQYPNTTREAWLTWATKERTKLLKELLENSTL